MACLAHADSFAPDYYEYRVRYSSGNSIIGWIQECDTDTNNPAEDWNNIPLGPWSCSVSNLGSEANPRWCDEQNIVQIQWQMSHEPDGGLPYEDTTTLWKDMYIINWDGDPNDCACYVAANRYNVGGDIAQCCGDDVPGEYYITESDSVLRDSGPSDACCDNDTKCVDDNNCYDNQSFHDIGELPLTNDLEKCEDKVWHDADESRTYCDMPGFNAGTCWDGTDTSCWRNEGENADFGEYDDAFGMVQYDCCGDDSGEYYIMTDYFNDACCDTVNDFVFSNGVCSAWGNRKYLYGRVYGKQADGSFLPMGGTLVQAIDPFDASVVNENYTNDQGYYNISVIPGIYDLLFRPPKVYKGATFRINVQGANIMTDYYADLLSSCLSDCTSYNNDFAQYYCNKACDGINGCSYNSSVISDFQDPAFTGKTMIELCHDLESDWTVPHNDSHDIICCNKGYIIKPEYTSATLGLSGSYKQIDSFYGGLVSYSGKFVSIWIAIGDD